MEVKELMIGDWFYILNFPEVGKKTPVKIVGMDTNHNAVEYVHNGIRLWSAVVRLEPIPITPEILGKNGFINGEFYGESHIEDWQIMSDGGHLAARSERGWCIDIPCHYVHELQHALRLCGIDKEIEL